MTEKVQHGRTTSAILSLSLNGIGGQMMKKSTTFNGPLPSNQAAIWKSPPGVVSHKPVVSSMSSGRLSELSGGSRHAAADTNPRLSPDSGRGSDPTGSDTSNFSDQEKVRGAPPRSSHISGYTPPGWQVRSARFTSPSPDRGGGDMYGYSARSHPPAYRPPPQPHGSYRNSSPASDPPPYREPPPPPGGRPGATPTSPVMGRHVSGLPQSPSPVVRAPHYSPPPHHREMRGHKGASPGRNISSHNVTSVRGVSSSPSRGQNSPSRSAPGNQWPPPARYNQQVIN